MDPISIYSNISGQTTTRSKRKYVVYMPDRAEGDDDKVQLWVRVLFYTSQVILILIIFRAVS